MTKPTSGLSRPPGASVAEPGPATLLGPEPRVRGRWWALAAIALSFLVVGLDSYIVVTALPTFSLRLGASESQLQWVTAAYTLAWAGLLLPIGKLGDKLGRRRLLTAGLAVFGIASVVASQVSTAGELIALRAVMGAGAAVIMPMGLAIIPVLFPGQADRRRAVTVTTVGALVAMPLGPLLGGWILTHFAWGWIFLINAPIAARPCSASGCWSRRAGTRPTPGWTGPAPCCPRPASSASCTRSSRSRPAAGPRRSWPACSAAWP